MQKTISYREAFAQDIENIFILISACFDEFVAVDYHKNGIAEFYRQVNPEILMMQMKKGYYTGIALNGEQIVGAIQLKEYHHISLLFVEKDYQGKGIGRMLIKSAIQKCKESGASIKRITVDSTPFAVKVYEKLGFKKNRFEQNIHGIRFTPMEFLI